MEYTEEENKTMSGLFSNKEKIDVNIVIYCKGANIKQKTIFWVFEVKKTSQELRMLSRSLSVY